MARKAGKVITVTHLVAVDRSGEKVAEFSVEQDGPGAWSVRDVLDAKHVRHHSQWSTRQEAMDAARAEALTYVTITA